MTPQQSTLSLFDRSIPTHVDALYDRLTKVAHQAAELINYGHECDCEFCEERDDPYLKESNQEEYNLLVTESKEIAETLKRCIRWVEFKEIQLKRHVSPRAISNLTVDPWEGEVRDFE